jgi:hypothetical protein
MKPLVEPLPGRDANHTPPDVGEVSREAVLRELDSILASHYFQHAGRCKQFLRYVVEQKLEGQQEKLKERTIGTEVFQRPPGYATGDDPVVRVQAGEVRRRLEQYYQEMPQSSELRIELPVGSYSPLFQLRPSQRTREPEAQPAEAGATGAAATPSAAPVSHWKSLLKVIVLVAAGAAATLATISFTSHRDAVAKSVLDQFWAPVFTTRQPVLICLAKPVAYRPSEEIYRRYSRTHPGTFETEAERSNIPLPLDSDEQLTWGDFFVYTDYGVAAGDVSAAVALSGLFGKIDKPNQLRIGSAYTYEDLRNSPAVAIGGFNNKWTMQLVSSLRFALVEDNEHYMIREQIPGGRVWTTRLGPHGETLEDFAIVSRLIDSKTGQFTVTVAGIGPKGTQTAGEFVSSARYLEEGLAGAPADWPKRNLQILLQTTVTDSVSGPPHVIATYAW